MVNAIHQTIEGAKQIVHKKSSKRLHYSEKAAIVQKIKNGIELCYAYSMLNVFIIVS